MDQVWKDLSNLDPRDPGVFYKKPLLSFKALQHQLTQVELCAQDVILLSNILKK